MLHYEKIIKVIVVKL